MPFDFSARTPRGLPGLRTLALALTGAAAALGGWGWNSAAAQANPVAKVDERFIATNARTGKDWPS